MDLFIVAEECRTWEPAPEAPALAPRHIGSYNTTVPPPLSSIFISPSTDATREVARAAPPEALSIPVGLMRLLRLPTQSPPHTAPQRPATCNHSANTHGLQTFAGAYGPSMPYPQPLGGHGSDSDVIAWLGPHPIRESSRCTDMLAGGTVVQAEDVDFGGQEAVVFVFPVSPPVLLTWMETQL